MDNGAPQAMAPDEFVRALYRTCLGREVDSSGLATWTELIRKTGDPTRVLRGLIESQEYLARVTSRATSEKQVGHEDRGSDTDQEFRDYCTSEARRALTGLHRRLRVVDVGAQGVGSHAYAPLAHMCELEILGFDPLVERLRERELSEGASGLTLLPFALGDGSMRTLYINNVDATSSLFPLNHSHNARFNRLNQLQTVRTEQVATKRLDDVLPVGSVDFLSLDVQGAELMVLQGAESTLSKTAVVHCEVEFSPIYFGQPLFPAVQQHLMTRKFSLIDLLLPGRYYDYITPSGRTTPDRLLWADAVFFLETDDPETRRVQALVAASIYRKPNLAEYLLR